MRSLLGDLAAFNYLGKLKGKIGKAWWYNVPRQERQRHDTGSSREEASPSSLLRQKSCLASTEAACWLESALH